MCFFQIPLEEEERKWKRRWGFGLHHLHPALGGCSSLRSLSGSCGWLWPELQIQSSGGIGASPPPICFDRPDPGVYVGWILRRLQRGVILYRFLLATLLLLAVVFASGVLRVEMRAAAERCLQKRSHGPSCNFAVVQGLFCFVGTADMYLDVTGFA